MKRWMRGAAFLLAMASLGWGPNNPSGDIQPMGGSSVPGSDAAGTISNLEPTPALVRYQLRVDPALLAGAAESTGLYFRLSPGSANYFGLYAEIDNTQVDQHGGFAKLVHFGAGDGYYTALRGGGIGSEAASYSNGSRGFLATLQKDASLGTTLFGNSVLYQGVWGDDGTGGATVVPNYGMLYLSRSLGNGILIQKQDPLKSGVAEGRTEVRISEFDFSRNRYELYNTGEQRLYSPIATVGQQYPTGSALRLSSSWWNGGAPTDLASKLVTSISGSGVGQLDVSVGTLAAETLSASFKTTGVVVPGTLAVTGASTLAGVTGTTGAFSSTLAATRINLTGGSELSFAGNIVYESDGASVYLSPSNDTTGSLYAYTGGAQRLSISSLGAIGAGGAVSFGSTLGVTGTSTLADTVLGSSNSLSWTSKSKLTSAADGYLSLQNNAASDALVGFRYGGVTSSFPMWKRAASSTTLAARLADDSADAPISGSNLTASGTLNVTGVSTLGTTNTGALGATTITASSTLGVTGTSTLADTVLGAGNSLSWTGRSKFSSAADGYASLQNNAGTDVLIGLRLGGVTSSFPMWKRAASSTTLAARLADDSADAALTAAAGTFSGAVVVNGGQGIYIKGGNGTASPIADTNVPLQIDSGSAGTLKVSYFGANKNGSYGVLFGYSNDSGATGGVGGQFRMVTADPFSIVTNNSTLAAQWASNGNLTLFGTTTTHPAAGNVTFTGRAQLSSSADGILVISPNAGGAAATLATGIAFGTSAGLFYDSASGLRSMNAAGNVNSGFAGTNFVGTNSNTFYGLTGASAAGMNVGTTSNIDLRTNGVVALNTNSAAQINSFKPATLTKTSAYPVTVTDSFTVFNNTAAGSQVVYTLPAAAIGLTYTFVNTAAGASFTEVLAVGTDKIAQNGTLGGAAGNLTSTGIWTTVKIVCFIAGTWIVESSTGTWTLT